MRDYQHELPEHEKTRRFWRGFWTVGLIGGLTFSVFCLTSWLTGCAELGLSGEEGAQVVDAVGNTLSTAGAVNPVFGIVGLALSAGAAWMRRKYAEPPVPTGGST